MLKMRRNRKANLLASVCMLTLVSACSTTTMPNPTDVPPLYGNYENIDTQSLCLGIMAFSADFPKAVWPNQSKDFYSKKKEHFGIQSAALYKISLDKYGKQDAAERGITGYSSAKSLAYVMGPKAVREALGRCQAVADQALAIDTNYQNFLAHLSEKPSNPSIPEIVATPTPILPKKKAL